MTTTQSDRSPALDWLQKQEYFEFSKEKIQQPVVLTPVDLAHRVKQVQEWLYKGVVSELHFTEISKEDLEALVSELADKGIKLK
jgi:hypothetical protein